VSASRPARLAGLVIRFFLPRKRRDWKPNQFSFIHVSPAAEWPITPGLKVLPE
jgi:hypothetical protein